MKVKITRDIHVWIDNGAVSWEGRGNYNVFYEAGYEGTAPRAHIDYIVAKEAGHRLDFAGDDPENEDAEAAEAAPGAADDSAPAADAP